MSLVERRSSGTNSTARRSRGASKRMASTPSGVMARHDEPAEERGRGVVRVALDAGRDAELVAACRAARRAARSAATTPATVAAADEPRPRDERDLVVHLDPPADALGQLAAGRADGRLEAAHESVVAVVGELVAALALDGQLDLAAAPAADLDLDPVGQGQRDPRQSKPAPRLADEAGHLDGDLAAVELREPVRDHRQPPAERDGDRARGSARPR